MKKIFLSILLLPSIALAQIPDSTHWIPAGYGGGGQFCNIVYDATTPNRLYAVSDVSNFYISTNNGLNWNFSQSGLSLSQIADVVQAPSNTSYLAVDGNKGVGISSNGGASWSMINKTIGCTRTSCHSALAFDRNTTATLYAGDDSGNVWYTTNSGSTWNTLTTMSKQIQALYISQDDTTLFIGTKAGVRVWTISGGAYTDVTFSGNNSTNINNVTEIRGYTYGSTNYVAMTAGFTLALTSNDGSSFTYSANLGFSNTSWQIYRFDVATYQGSTQIEAIVSTGGSSAQAMYTSSNNGGSWTSTPTWGSNITYDTTDDPTRTWTSGAPGISSTTINPFNLQQSYFSDDWGMYRTDNAGSTYTEYVAGAQNGVLTDIQLAPDGSIIASGEDNGILRSTNQGASWTALSPNSTSGQNYPQFSGHYWKFTTQGSAAQWNAGTGTIIACTSPWALDNGSGQANQIVYNNFSGSGVWHIASTAPFNGVYLYNGMWGLGYCRAMANNTASGTVWIGMDGSGSGQGGIYYSTNAGVTWTRAGQPGYDQTFYNALDVLQSDTSGNTVIYAGWGSNGGNSPYLTTNGGSSWSYLQNGLENVYQIKYDQVTGYIYAGATGPSLWMSTTGTFGSFNIIHTFTTTMGTGAVVDGLTFNPNNHNNMAISVSYPGTAGKIWMTVDLQDGANSVWQDITGDLPAYSGSNKMVWNPSEGTSGYLYIVTYGSGVFKINLALIDAPAYIGGHIKGGQFSI